MSQYEIVKSASGHACPAAKGRILPLVCRQDQQEITEISLHIPGFVSPPVDWREISCAGMKSEFPEFLI
jgi:hypothetical protein